jgi:DNA processing protein
VIETCGGGEVFRSYYPYLALLCIEGFGGIGSERLWQEAGRSPRDFYDQLKTTRGRRKLSMLLDKPLGEIPWDFFQHQLEAIENAQINVLCLADEEYPQYLRDIRTAPPVIFYRGRINTLARRGVAIVGTRQPSPRGAAFTRILARDLSACGIMVASGLARGIDTAAHRGALEERGPVVGVIGTGLDVCYPLENRSLMEEIASRGCLLTEQFVGVIPRKYVFPLRNRIISAVSRIVIVVEAGSKSGALITATWANEQGREVGAVPAFPGDFRSNGVNKLLKMGATPIESVNDVLEAVPLLAEDVNTVPAGGAKRHEGSGGAVPSPQDMIVADRTDLSIVYNAMTSTPVDIDALASHLEMNVAELQSKLLELEMRGLVGRDLAGCYYRLK